MPIAARGAKPIDSVSHGVLMIVIRHRLCWNHRRLKSRGSGPWLSLSFCGRPLIHCAASWSWVNGVFCSSPRTARREPGKRDVISAARAEVVNMRSSRSSLSSSFLRRRRSCSESFSRRRLRISYMAHSRTSSATRVRGAPCFDELRTYRRVTSVAPSIENAMQYASFLFQPIDSSQISSPFSRSLGNCHIPSV